MIYRGLLLFTFALLIFSSINFGKENFFYLKYRLPEIGKKYNCFFTVEGAWEKNGVYNCTEMSTFPARENLKSLEDEINFIKLSCPTLIFKTDNVDKNIIHVIDSRLLKKNYYVMNLVEKDFRFSGTSHNLVEFFIQRKYPIEFEMNATQGPGPESHSFPSVISGKGMTVREILSNAIAPNDRNRLIWISHTGATSDEIVTRFEFRWPSMPDNSPVSKKTP